MTRARRRSKRVGVDLERLAELYLHGDGTVDWLFDEPAMDRFTAKASWPAARVAAWRLWFESEGVRAPQHPPGGAVAWDGLSDGVWTVRWPFRDEGTPAATRRRIRAVGKVALADLAAMEKWRTANPDDAAPIAGELDHYAAALRTVAAVSEECRTAEDCQTAWHGAFVARRAQVGG